MLRRLGVGACAAAMVAALGAIGAGADPAPPAPTFAIGDGNAAPGTPVEFWGAQWWKDNAVGGGAPASFKGFAVTITPTGPCTGTFTTDPGNSSDPPATIGGKIPVLVVSSVTKTGPMISGTYSDMVMVTTDPGYGPAPGHAGTGTVTGGSLCVPPGPGNT